MAADFQDGWITTKVQAKYFTEPDVKGRDIDVTTDAGVVTLSGVVENDQARQRALQLARETDGVVRVEDRLTVESAQAADAGQSPADRAQPGPATQDSQEAARQPAPSEANRQRADASGTPPVAPVNPAPIGTGGDASAALEAGKPITPGAPPAAGTAAAGGGVGDVLRQEQRSDDGITTRIQARFFTDDQVRARDIDVSTQNQVVTLQGTVQTDAERQHALSIARDVEGVRGVEDRLQVEGTSGPARIGDESGPARSGTNGADDTWITTQVQSRYYLDDLLRGTRVNVSTQRGIVTLSGQVASEDAKRRAEQLARDVQGATRVENRLSVRATEQSGPPAPGSQGQPQSAQPAGQSQEQRPEPATSGSPPGDRDQ